MNVLEKFNRNGHVVVERLRKTVSHTYEEARRELRRALHRWENEGGRALDERQPAPPAERRHGQ